MVLMGIGTICLLTFGILIGLWPETNGNVHHCHKCQGFPNGQYEWCNYNLNHKNCVLWNRWTFAQIYCRQRESKQRLNSYLKKKKKKKEIIPAPLLSLDPPHIFIWSVSSVFLSWLWYRIKRGRLKTELVNVEKSHQGSQTWARPVKGSSTHGLLIIGKMFLLITMLPSSSFLSYRLNNKSFPVSI